MSGELAMTNIIASSRAIAMNAQVLQQIADGFGLDGVDLEDFGEGFDTVGETQEAPAPEVAQLASGMVPGFLTAQAQQAEGGQQ